MSQPRRRTYWHLEGLGRKPVDYDIATSRLLYYPARGFEVAVPMADWYRRHQQGSPLQAGDWDAFRDPRETTYASYTELANVRETYLDGLFDAIETTGYDARLRPAWVALLARVVAPLRFPVHGLQMAAAYLGSMAPGGRVVVAAAFQAADEMRRVQRLAYRMAQLRLRDPRFGEDSKRVWQSDPAWQPMRQVIERLLCTWDVGEALVALNLVVKPAFDQLFMVDLARLAERRGDEVLARILASLEQDCVWHRAWTAALVDALVAQRADNRQVIDRWIEGWRPAVDAAVAAFAPVMAGAE